MSSQRFVLNLTPGKTAEETAGRAMQELIRLTEQLNAARIPIVVGPNENLPEGMVVGQPVIDWRTGTGALQIWDGKSLV